MAFQDVCRSDEVVPIATGVEGGFLLLVAIVILVVFLKKKRKSYTETAQTQVDVYALYNTYYAGDERMENRMVVTLNSI